MSLAFPTPHTLALLPNHQRLSATANGCASLPSAAETSISFIAQIGVHIASTYSSITGNCAQITPRSGIIAGNNSTGVEIESDDSFVVCQSPVEVGVFSAASKRLLNWSKPSLIEGICAAGVP